MLGYGTTQKGYRLYDLERMKVIHNRDVIFNEKSTPGIQKESPCEYVELKVDDEPNIEHTVVQNSTDTETDKSDSQVKRIHQSLQQMKKHPDTQCETSKSLTGMVML